MDKGIVSNELSLDQKLMIWKQYDDHVNKIDSSLISVTTILSVLFTAITGLNVGGIVILYALPAIALLFLFYISYQQRVVEILRGYLCFIEEDIRSQTGYTAITWNSFGVMKNYNVGYFRAQLLCGPLFICYIVPIIGYSFFKMFKDNIINKIAIIVYLILVVVFAVACALDMLDNSDIHSIVKKYLNDGKLGEFPVKAGNSFFNKILFFWNRRK